MLILHRAPQLKLPGYLKQSTEFLWPNRAKAYQQLRLLKL